LDTRPSTTRRGAATRLLLLGALVLGTACAEDEDLPDSNPGATPANAEVPATGADDMLYEDAAAALATDATADWDGRVSAQDAASASAHDAGAEAQTPALNTPPGRDAGPSSQDATTAPDAAAPPVTIFLAGDSIVQTYSNTASDHDQAGWGQMLEAYFDSRVTIENHAIGGRTARRFIDENRLDAIVRVLAPGDYLLVQFGTNDGNRSASYMLGTQSVPYFLDAQTDFKSYLKRYVDSARAAKAFPVLVTPTPRNSAYCTGGNGTAAYATAMKELGQMLAVPVVDLNTRTVSHLRAICPAPTPENFFLLRSDGTVDGTHFQEHGARILASFVADELTNVAVSLGAYRVEPPTTFSRWGTAQ
jgi:lysophospholipase L1-like esterase